MTKRMIVSELSPYLPAREYDHNLKKIDTYSHKYQYDEFEPDGGPFDSVFHTLGIPIKPSTLPSQIRYEGARRKKTLPDVFHCSSYQLVRDNFKSLVEQFEPDTHQFHKVKTFWKNMDFAEDIHIFIPTKRLDCADREKTTFTWKTNEITNVSWWYFDRKKPDNLFVVDNKKIDGHHIWKDRYILSIGPTFVSDKFADECMSQKITGLEFINLTPPENYFSESG